MNDQKIRASEVFSRLPLFQALQPGQLERLAQSARELRIAKNETLFERGKPATGFYIVMFGQIKLVISSSQGDEKVMEIIGQRQSFGEAVMFLGRPYPVTAIGLTDTLLLYVPKDIVDELLEQDVGFARGMLAGLSIRVHTLLKDVESQAINSTAQRVIGYLLQRCPDDESDTATIELPTSKLLIASRLSITPETLSRVFAKLASQQLIDVQGRNIDIPSIKKLQEFSE